eukprot:TRINITY_DN26591_c0_g1_i1.p2 TRINITY_DN26591_c0_g1~~TRINITY_DN26591_c0_g1_i1.p2  ORF type:complete len:175 (-),score=34.91 TRINITY_DN26591_c0_g1_i1:45-569(-)
MPARAPGTEASMTFWRRVLEEIPVKGQHDQKIVNNLLYSEAAAPGGMKWTTFPRDIWASSQAFDGKAPRGLALHHANWVLRPVHTWKVESKEDGGAAKPAGAGDPSSKIQQLNELRSLVEQGDDLESFTRTITEDPALEVYHRRAVGDKRSGPEWAVLPEGHPARPGGRARRKR